MLGILTAACSPHLIDHLKKKTSEEKTKISYFFTKTHMYISEMIQTLLFNSKYGIVDSYFGDWDSYFSEKFNKIAL